MKTQPLTLKKTKASKAPKKTKTPQVNYNEEFLVVSHLVKYNLYLLCKSMIFSSIVGKYQEPMMAVEDTNKIMKELDLDSKLRDIKN